MNIAFIILLIVLIIAIVVVSCILIIKTENELRQNIVTTIYDILDMKHFSPLEVHYVNRKLTIAVNKTYTKLAVIENFNPKNPEFYNYYEIPVSFIETIEKNVAIKINYVRAGAYSTFQIYPANQEIQDFIHRVFKNSCIKKVQNKYPDVNFSCFSASDWQVSYLWAFSKRNSRFVYFQTGKKQNIKEINLKREHFTIDTKYNYFEVPLFSRPQQLFTYDKEFLPEIWELLKEDIIEKYSTISENEIYFDYHSNILYLTNGTTSLQSIILDEVEEIIYRENRISFELLESQKVINFMANNSFISKFEDFIINKNLKKIAQGFNQKTDRIINATHYTKFIIDYSRDRMIYCANMNKIRSFNYMIIPFLDLYDAQVNQSGMNNFVRIFTKNKEMVDVSCDKREVAQYIQAQIKGLLN